MQWQHRPQMTPNPSLAFLHLRCLSFKFHTESGTVPNLGENNRSGNFSHLGPQFTSVAFVKYAAILAF